MKVVRACCTCVFLVEDDWIQKSGSGWEWNPVKLTENGDGGPPKRVLVLKDHGSPDLRLTTIPFLSPTVPHMIANVSDLEGAEAYDLLRKLRENAKKQ